MSQVVVGKAAEGVPNVLMSIVELLAEAACDITAGTFGRWNIFNRVFMKGLIEVLCTYTPKPNAVWCTQTQLVTSCLHIVGGTY